MEIILIQDIVSFAKMNRSVVPLPVFKRVLWKHTWRYQVIIQFTESLPVSIIESCHSEGAKLELIQFVTLTFRTLIKKDLLTMALVLMRIV